MVVSVDAVVVKVLAVVAVVTAAVRLSHGILYNSLKVLELDSFDYGNFLVTCILVFSDMLVFGDSLEAPDMITLGSQNHTLD